MPRPSKEKPEAHVAESNWTKTGVIFFGEMTPCYWCPECRKEFEVTNV